MLSNPDFDYDLDNIVSHEAFYTIQQDLHRAKAEVRRLVEENRVLTLKSLELKAQVELEQGRRHEIEQNVSKVINSPGSMSDQLKMWSEQVKVLKQITNLQSSLIDKDFIIKQNDVIKDLRGALELAAPEHSDADENIEVSISESERESDAHFSTVDEAPCSPAAENTPNEDNSCPPPKFKKGNTYALYNSSARRPAATSVSLADLHTQDRERVHRFARVVDRLHSLPEHVNTLLLMDSNGHKIKGRQIDSVNRSTWVLSSGGLCLPAAVHALQQHGASHKFIRKVAIVIGTNDYLHRTQHVVGKKGRYLKALSEVIGKLFPNASLHFVLPFTGGKIPKSYIDRLHSDITENIPECAVLSPPDMRSKLSDGVHLNQGGISRFLTFLQEHLVPRRPAIFSRESGRRSSSPTYAGSLNPVSPMNRHVSPPATWNSPDRNQWFSSSPVTELSPCPPQIDQSLIAEVTKKVISELMSRNLLNNAY